MRIVPLCAGRRALLALETMRRTSRVSTIGIGLLVSGSLSAQAQVVAPVKKAPSAVNCQVITAEQIARHTTVTRALRSKVTGLQLSATSGQAGAGSVVVLRGISSARGKVPLIIVDGLRMGAAAGAGQDISILDQLNPEDVLRIEVFRGPAATTLYGTDAAGGLIRVYTKQGNPSAELLGDVRARCTP